MVKNPKDLIQMALERDELTELLLGTPEYRYNPKHSSSIYETDLVDLLCVLYDMQPIEKHQEIALKLERSFREIVNKYEGIIPASLVILVERIRKKNANSPLGLPLEDFALELKKSIIHFHDRLANDKTGVGKDYPDGLLGDLRRLNKNIVSIGGPSFFP